MNDKIFLSYKSTDQLYVEEVANALKMVGFKTWFDKESLTKTRELDKQLIEGMEESCAVVFFITSNYNEKDGYLSDELRYAGVQKKKKKDNFVYIILLIPDESISDIEELQKRIPETLRSKIYELALNPLQAFTIIVKHLPIIAGISILQTGLPIFKNRIN